MIRRICLDCAGRTSREVLERLDREVAPSSYGSRIVLVVENLNRIEDSLTAVLNKLFFFIKDRRINASIIDRSGHTAVLREALGLPPST